MSQELESLVAELIEASPGGVPPHPEPRRLLDYHARLLEETEASAVREHLASCRSCAAALVDLGELHGAGADDETAGPVADYGTAAAWKSLAPHLAEPPLDAMPALSSNADRWWPRVAAILALATLGLGFWSLRLGSSHQILENRLARLEAPRANAAVLYLEARMRSEPTVPEISRREGQVLVFLTPPEHPPTERYRVEFRDEPGHLVASVGGLIRHDLGALRFSLAANTLGIGEHQILLFANEGDEVLASYRLEVVETSRATIPEP